MVNDARSRLVNDAVVFRHVEDAAYLWTQRELCLRTNRRSRTAWLRFDTRLDAHLDGVRLAGDAGFDVCIAELEQWGHAGEAFAASVVALDDTSGARMERLAPHIVDDATRTGLVAAASWHPKERIGPWLLQWAGSSEPLLAYVGLAGLAVHRALPERALERGLASQEPDVRARAARAAEEMGAVERAGRLLDLCREEDARVRCNAAIALTRLGYTHSLVEDILIESSIGDGRRAELAAAALARSAPRDVAARLQQWTADGSRGRSVVAMAEAVGDASTIRWLLDWMNDPRVARAAGDAFCTVTGAYIDRDELGGPSLLPEPSPTNEDEPEFDEPLVDQTLLWPDAMKCEQFYLQRKNIFAPEMRCLAGFSIGRLHRSPRRDESASLMRLLVEGTARQRACAAQVLAQHSPDLPLVETRASSIRRRVLPGMSAWPPSGASGPPRDRHGIGGV